MARCTSKSELRTIHSAITDLDETFRHMHSEAFGFSLLAKGGKLDAGRI
jgi:hypothetical protein